MKIAHVLVCHSVDPTKAIESIPVVSGSPWYVFLHSNNEPVENAVRSLMSKREAKVLAYRQNRGLSCSWNDALEDAFSNGCEAMLILNDDLFFYDGAYTCFRHTIEALRGMTDNVSYASLHGLEAGGPQIGQSIPQQFACCAIMREAVERVGYFDENFFPAYYEDCDYDWRAFLSGMTVHIDPRTLVEHMRQGTKALMSPSEIETFERDYAWNTSYFHRKWGVDGIHHPTSYRRPFDCSSFDLRIDSASRAAPYGQKYDR